ncbi:hypothetical protein PFISCL1PPCAC_19910 [Pristionchus fissidentatus]|uniref:SEC7 domain-containing protein n=1 Tax=Pristionchus fissidentatus TaxID=1538716 RepID=A0AAV5WD37_9BILA|nr:hypothetical protein PFISCL1PPCAC_19910 [Pristionchus fissidentatus]
MHLVSSSSTSPMFLNSAIEKILVEKDIKRKENTELKKACESTLDQLKSIIGEKGVYNGILPDKDVSVKAENFLLPFELACRSKSPKIVIIALDCLQKLVSYGHINGSATDKTNPDRSVTDRIITIICSSFERDHADESVLLQILKAVLAVVLSNDCPVHEKSLLDSVRVCFTIFLVTKSPINEATARGSLSQIINGVFSRMEKMGDDKDDERIVKDVMESIMGRIINDTVRVSGDSSSVNDSECSPDIYQFYNVYQKDAFLVFRALCVLSQKEEGDQNDPKDTHLRSKTFALEMLLLVLQSSGPVLHNSPPFISVIKRSLCVTLSNNAVSPIVAVFEKTLAIFVELLDKLKHHLKLQIEVFFKDMILSMLDSPSCSFEHKWVLLNTVSKVVCAPRVLVDIFVNYDCDLTCHNIFASLVDVISKSARLSISEISPQKERDREMRLLGLDCLVEIMKGQVDWYLTCERNEEASMREGEKSGKREEDYSQLEQQKQMKDKMEQGIDLFSRKPNKGLQFLQEHGFVGREPVEIAEFLMKEERLDKTVVGDFLGDANEFNKSVMYAYVDDMDFSSRDLVTSLRFFLEKFRLPGEAQKIDRLMEKFASRYCDCNPSLGIFASADTAYVLSYSIILLTTDLHSSQVRNKMTKEQYVSMNRGINNGGDVDKELLESIYDDISANEIKMKGGATKLIKAQGRKADAKIEMAAMGETARVLMESASKNDALFVPASHQDHVRPMFKMCWASSLAAFSLGVQMSDDLDEWKLCLKGFKYSIRLASLIDATTERDAFMQALGRFTLLAPRSIMSEMRDKNIEAIKLMLLIGDECGNDLCSNWFEVLKCVSQLELVSLIGTGLRSGSITDSSTSANYVAKSTGQDEKSLSLLQLTLTETASQSVVVAVDRLFENSSRLSSDGVVHFVSALCRVSQEELSLPSGPRMFLLSKIVEVAFYNMGRIRLEWSRIWTVIGEHLKNAGCNDNESVAHFSVDALRQLAIKFMEKGELPNYRFQKEFLRPFEVIMARNGNGGTRELVIACTALMVEGHGERIKSGWINLFSIWSIAATDANIDIVEMAFRAVSSAVNLHFKSNFASVLDAFQEALKCLAEFACNPNLAEMNMEAIELIRQCAQCVALNEEIIVDSPWEEKFSMKGEQRIWLRGWFPIFFELSCIINRCKLDIRTRSLTVMFDILKSHGNSLRADWWNDLFRIIYRIFDHAKQDDGRSDKSEWLKTTCNHAMYKIVDIITQFFPTIGPLLLPSLYDQFLSCLNQNNEQLSRTSVSCLKTVIIMNGHLFDHLLWEKTIRTITSIFDSTLPKNLIDHENDANEYMNGKIEEDKKNAVNNLHWLKDEEVDKVLVMCLVQTDLVEAVSAIVLTSQTGPGLCSSISPSHLLSICSCLLASLRLATSFNASNGERTLLWKAGLRGSSKPDIQKLETRSVSTLFSILIGLLMDDRAIERKAEVSSLLSSTVSDCIDSFNTTEMDSRRAALSPVITRLFEECIPLSRDVLYSSLGDNFPQLLCDLVVTADSKELRTQLSSLLKVFCIQ